MNPTKLAGLILATLTDAGNQGMPSGHLYSVLMQYVSLNDYQSVIGALKSAGYLTNEYHLLRATGEGTRLGTEVNAMLAQKKENK